jgi:hypothetical protein
MTRFSTPVKLNSVQQASKTCSTFIGKLLTIIGATSLVFTSVVGLPKIQANAQPYNSGSFVMNIAISQRATGISE